MNHAAAIESASELSDKELACQVKKVGQVDTCYTQSQYTEG